MFGRKKQQTWSSTKKCDLGVKSFIENYVPVERVKEEADMFGKGAPIAGWISKKCQEELDRREYEELKRQMRMKRQIEKELDQEEMSR